MADLLALERWCNALPDQIDKAANTLAVTVTQTMGDDLVDHTPVDTSEAESNWQASVNGAPGFPLPPIYPGERGSTAAQSAREAKAHIARALKDKDPGVPVWLSNVAEHIVDLNNGTSKQEPAGFVERGIRVGELKADSTGLEIKA
jgi:hypothetical protein